jgi:hypothetical protein
MRGNEQQLLLLLLLLAIAVLCSDMLLQPAWE